MMLARMHVRTLPVLVQHARAHARAHAPVRSNGGTACWELMLGLVWEQRTFDKLAGCAVLCDCSRELGLFYVHHDGPHESKAKN